MIPGEHLDFILGNSRSPGILGDARAQLLYPTRRDHYEARSLGFVNAEHEVLAFFASAWYFRLINAVLGCCTHVPKMWTPREIAQEILDQAYGGAVRMNSHAEIMVAPPPLVRNGTKPKDCRGYDYPLARGLGNTDILTVVHDVYGGIIIDEHLEACSNLSGVEPAETIFELQQELVDARGGGRRPWHPDT
jgi:hypothetical protein